MEFQQVVDRRRMIRNYSERQVDPGAIARALRNATRAPSAGFSQGWAFVVLDEPGDVRRYWEATTEPEQLDAARPVAGRHDAGAGRSCSPAPARMPTSTATPSPTRASATATRARWRVPYWHMDTAMASLLILQTVVDEGLGALFFGIPTDRIDAVRREFAIPDTHDPIGAITIGHLADDAGVPGSPAHRGGSPSTSSSTAAAGEGARRLTGVDVEEATMTEEEARQTTRGVQARDARTGTGAAAARIHQQHTWVDLQVRQAMARGDFDDLPGAGKPIRDLGTQHDPDWWVKQLIEREHITGVLPAALQLRKDDAGLDQRLDSLDLREEVRREVEDFNTRVIRARYTPVDGPPLITMPRDVEETLGAWRERRSTRHTGSQAPRASEPPRRRRRWLRG